MDRSRKSLVYVLLFLASILISAHAVSGSRVLLRGGDVQSTRISAGLQSESAPMLVVLGDSLSDNGRVFADSHGQVKPVLKPTGHGLCKYPHVRHMFVLLRGAGS